MAFISSTFDDIQKDSRFKIIKKETTNEANSSNLNFSFSGFGRSTDRATDELNILSKGQERETYLLQLINAERYLEYLYSLPDVGESALTIAKDTLARLQNIHQRLGQEARQRRQNLLTKQSEIGQREDAEFFQKFTPTRQSQNKSFKLKIRPAKAAKQFNLADTNGIVQIKGLVQPKLDDIKPLKGVDNIFALSELKPFGT